MLPSIHSPSGLSKDDARRTIKVNRARPARAHYKLKLRSGSFGGSIDHNSSPTSRQIEIIPVHDSKTALELSDFISSSRTDGILKDLDSMDVDSTYTFTRTVTVVANISYLVLDTNFILSHLDVVDQLLKLAPIHGLELIVPQQVIRELDGLKSSDKSMADNSVSHLARWANDWIYSRLSSSDSHVTGQKKDQQIDKFADKDDAILDCCLWLKRERPKSLQVLMSNDKNLCMKALLEDILTVSFREQMSAEIIARTIQNENVARFGIINGEVITQTFEAPRELQPVSVVADPALTVFHETEKLVISIVHHSMVQEYGEDLVLVKNYSGGLVRTLEDAATVVSRFWASVFLSYFRERNFKGASFLHVPNTNASALDFINFWGDFLQTLYSRLMDRTQNKALLQIIDRWKGLARQI